MGVILPGLSPILGTLPPPPSFGPDMSKSAMSSKWTYPKIPGDVILPKNKMVRMVHTNNFYEMGLAISDPTKELWTKTEILKGWGISKFGFEVQSGLLRVSTRPKLILKIFWTIPDPLQTKFHIFLYDF